MSNIDTSAYTIPAPDYRAIGLWYAFGQMDAGIRSDVLTSDHAFEFARKLVAMRKDYDDGKTYSFPSVQSAWRDFLATL